MNYRLGLDLGTSSLGWCALLLDNNEADKLLDFGVRIFPDGRNDKKKDPLCVERRNARSMRRRLARFKLRQRQLIEDLTQAGLFPATNQERKKLEKQNPYELRAKALHETITLFELGRCLFHLNQRRGFLSNRKEELDQKSSSKTQKAIDELLDKIKQADCHTLGEYMYKTKQYRFKNATDDAGKLYPNRSMYIDEFDKIWDCQKEYYKDILTDELKTKLRDRDIFFQRPLKKQEVGYCSLEIEEKRAPRAYSIFQDFRIISEIMNLEIIYPEKRSLTKDERNNLINFLCCPTPNTYNEDFIIPFEKIIKHLQLSDDTIFNLMKGSRQGLYCNITAAILNTSDTLGEVWATSSFQEQNQIVDILVDYTLSKERIREILSDMYPTLSDQQIDNTIQASLLLPDKYGNLSAKSMRKLAEEMKDCGVTYEEAVENIYHKNPLEIQQLQIQQCMPKYQEVFAEQVIGGNKEKYSKDLDYDNYMGRITNVSVHIALNQMRAVVNSLIEKYGPPSEITIELGRELKNGKKALAQIEKKQRENLKITEEARRAICSFGVAVTPFNIEKYKVWHNLNPKDALSRMDIYTGKNISLKELFDSNYEIEHILPYSWTYDDSYNNKIITRKNINHEKNNLLPYDFFSNPNLLKTVLLNDEELEDMSLDKVIARAKLVDKARGNSKKIFNFKAIAWRFSKNAKDIFNRNNKNMARDLTDMQYMSKLAKRYLTTICPDNKIISAKGTITDLLKKVWNINDVLPEDFRLWTVQKWQKDTLIEEKRSKLAYEHPDSDDEKIEELAKSEIASLTDDEIHNLTSVKKDRSIHYHHVLDAFVLANITHSIIQKISGKDFANAVEEYQVEHNKTATTDKDITLHEARFNLLKQNGVFYEKPYLQFNKDEFAQKLKNITVSYKTPIDKLKSIIKKANFEGKNLSSYSFTSINKDSAYGFDKITKISSSDIKIDFHIHKKDKKCIENKSLSCLVPIFRNAEQKAQFLKLYPLWQQACVRKKHLGKEAYSKIEQDFLKTFSKDKAYKWFESDGNYAAQIYQINKNDKFTPNKHEAWSLEIISNYYAFERKGKFFWKDIYPTAKLITTLHINDVVEATFEADDDLADGFSKVRNWIKSKFAENPTATQLKLLFRVKKMSGGNIFLRPLHIAQEDADVKSWQCSIGKFQQYQCRKVCITPLGQVIRG